MAHYLYLKSDNLIKVTELKDAITDTYINDATINMSLVKQEPLNPVAASHAMKALEFTSGGTAELSVGDGITGASSGAKATVGHIVVDSGTWAGGDAAGTIYLYNQTGTFSSESLNQDGGQADIATIAGDSDDTITIFEITGHGLTAEDHVRIVGTVSYDAPYPTLDPTIQLDDVVDEDHIAIELTHVEEAFTGEEDFYVGVPNAQNIALAHEGGDPNGYYDGCIPDDILDVSENDVTILFIDIKKDTDRLTMAREFTLDYYPRD